MTIARGLLVVGFLVVGLSIFGSWSLDASGARSAIAGEAPTGKEPQQTSTAADSGEYFESRVAPLLTRHCTECHGAVSQKGRLDLSRKEFAFAGGDSGPSIVPGKSAESLLWEYVESDEMPENRPPLSPREKEILRAWIDAGAVWPDGAIAGAASPTEGNAIWMRRLTVPEYVETVRRGVGVDVEKEAGEILPRDLRADGFSNTAYSLSVDLEHVEGYAKLAEIIVGRMDIAALIAEHAPCEQATTDCLPQVIEGIGKWLLRGPLEEHEVAAFLRVATAVTEEGGDFHEAVGYVVEAMLQSPRFLYRIEKQRGGGIAKQAADSERVGDYELASRLSYILWGGPPDKELMRAADTGELSDRGGVEKQVQRMLRDPRVVARSARFIDEWLNLEQLYYLRPNKERFPHWHAALAADMREETLRFFHEIAWLQNRPLWDLMNAQVTFATPRLAKHYGLDVSSGVAAEPSVAAGSPHHATGQSSSGLRAADLQALYLFDEGSGKTVRDSSGNGDAVDLEIDDPAAVAWGEQGLTITRSTRISSAGPPKGLIAAISDSNAITLEAWITPENDSQSGPARLITLSSGPSKRNFTLGQDGDKYEVRFRASRTDANGLPGVVTPAGRAAKRPTHVVYTRDSGGRARLYIDGVEMRNADVGGNVSTWDSGFTLTLANESTGDRPWLGTLHRVAIHSRALSPQEVLSISRINTPQRRYDLASVPGRGGLLTQGSVLTIGGDEASMVSRGLFVLQGLLYSRVGNPPACLDVTPVATKPGRSRRQIAMERVSSAACGGCHSKFEPLAFGLEKFDGLGSYQEMDEHGNKLREDGQIQFPGATEMVAYQSSAELMDLLAASDRVRMNMTRKLTQFAIGRPLVESDTAALDQIHRSAQEGGGTYLSLITTIVMSDLVQTTSLERAP